VSFQIIRRLLFQAIWRMITRIKGPPVPMLVLEPWPASKPHGLGAAKAADPGSCKPKNLRQSALLKTAEIPVQEVATRFGVSRSTLYRNKLASGCKASSSWQALYRLLTPCVSNHLASLSRVTLRWSATQFSKSHAVEQTLLKSSTIFAGYVGRRTA
jgi:hypothetical protein